MAWAKDVSSESQYLHLSNRGILPSEWNCEDYMRLVHKAQQLSLTSQARPGEHLPASPQRSCKIYRDKEQHLEQQKCPLSLHRVDGREGQVALLHQDPTRTPPDTHTTLRPQPDAALMSDQALLPGPAHAPACWLQGPPLCPAQSPQGQC